MTWWPIHSWHPVMVHLPLVGLILAVAFDIGSIPHRASRWRDTATIFWGVGFIGAVAALATGLIAYDRVDHSELAHPAMIWHRNLAIATVILLLAGALWRWRQPYSRGAAALGFVGAMALGGVGYLGGDLVYRHAIGLSNEILEQVAHERGGPAREEPATGDTSKTVQEHHHE